MFWGWSRSTSPKRRLGSDSNTVQCIFESETTSNKILSLDLVGCSIGEITSLVSNLTETPSIIDVLPEQKKRFVVPRDYNEYFTVLKTHFVDKFPEDPLISNLLRALLMVIQNNIFYSIAKFIKVQRFFKLSWKDDFRILADSNAFKVYYVRLYLRQAEKKLSESSELYPPEDLKVVRCLAALKKPAHPGSLKPNYS